MIVLIMKISGASTLSNASAKYLLYSTVGLGTDGAVSRSGEQWENCAHTNDLLNTRR